jgi:hypothetical protein
MNDFSGFKGFVDDSEIEGVDKISLNLSFTIVPCDGDRSCKFEVVSMEFGLDVFNILVMSDVDPDSAVSLVNPHLLVVDIVSSSDVSIFRPDLFTVSIVSENLN